MPSLDKFTLPCSLLQSAKSLDQYRKPNIRLSHTKRGKAHTPILSPLMRPYFLVESGNSLPAILRENMFFDPLRLRIGFSAVKTKGFI